MDTYTGLELAFALGKADLCVADKKSLLSLLAYEMSKSERVKK